jgi:hypothetical protein
VIAYFGTIHSRSLVSGLVMNTTMLLSLLHGLVTMVLTPDTGKTPNESHTSAVQGSVEKNDTWGVIIWWSMMNVSEGHPSIILDSDHGVITGVLPLDIGGGIGDGWEHEAYNLVIISLSFPSPRFWSMMSLPSVFFSSSASIYNCAMTRRP